MTIQFEGVFLDLTPEQEAIVKRNRQNTLWRSKDAFLDVLDRNGFHRQEYWDTWQHPKYGWIAILEESEEYPGVFSVWMAGKHLKDGPYPGGHKYKSWKVLEKEIKAGLEIMRPIDLKTERELKNRLSSVFTIHKK